MSNGAIPTGAGIPQVSLTAMASSLPITTTCYSQRLRELKRQLHLLEQQCRSGGLSEELEDLLRQQIRGLHASLWAIHAETEQD